MSVLPHPLGFLFCLCDMYSFVLPFFLILFVYIEHRISSSMSLGGSFLSGHFALLLSSRVFLSVEIICILLLFAGGWRPMGVPFAYTGETMAYARTHWTCFVLLVAVLCSCCCFYFSACQWF